jgi:NAD(P)-dependent dehydrogenase (short-subunit alcohol dehydrogenase family)
VIGVNLWGVLYGCHFFLPYLKQAGEAQIVNTSSMAGFLGLPNQASYSLTKAAVKSLSETLRVELAVHGIGVTSLHPGAIKTIMKAAATAVTRRDAAGRAHALRRPEKVAARRSGGGANHACADRIQFPSMEWLKRLLPVAIHTPFRWAFARAARLSESASPTGAHFRIG